MLPKKKRLNSREVARVFAEGDFFKTTHFSVKHLPAKSPAKFAVAVSKRLNYGPVAKNKAKRQVYNQLKDEQDSFPAATWSVIIIQKELTQEKASNLSTEIKSLLKKLNENNRFIDN